MSRHPTPGLAASVRRGLIALAIAAVVPVAGAQAVDGDTAVIDADAAQALRGRAAVNQAAGDNNVQANLAAIAFAPTTGAALAQLDARQHAQGGDRQRAAVARLGAGAFAGSAGLLSVNQTAGSGNAQLNLFALGHGVAMDGASSVARVDEAALAAVAGDLPTEGTGTPPMLREAHIDPSAFGGSQGVVQVNQTAGAGNASVNAIVLRIPGGTP